MIAVVNNAIELTCVGIKGKECFESYREIQRSYDDPGLSTVAKTAEIIAQGTFIATQTSEVVLNKISVVPLSNVINGAACVVKTGVHGYVRQEDIKETAIKIGKKIISHTGETLTTLIRDPRFVKSSIMQKANLTFFVVNTAISIYDMIKLQRHRLIVVNEAGNQP